MDALHTVLVIVVTVLLAVVALSRRTCGQLHEQIRIASAERAQAQRERDHEREVRLRQFHCVEDACRERDAIWHIYRKYQAGTGNLQDLLVRELGRLGRVHNRAAKRYGFEAEPPSKQIMLAFRSLRLTHGPDGAAKAAIQEQAATQAASEGSGQPNLAANSQRERQSS